MREGWTPGRSGRSSPPLNASAARADGASGFPALVLLGALAMLTLPHQFHVGVVECRDEAQLRTARWLFPLYMLLIALPILPLARAGGALLAPHGVPRCSRMTVVAGPGLGSDLHVALLAPQAHAPPRRFRAPRVSSRHFAHL